MIFDAHSDILTDIYQGKRNGMADIFKNKHLENFKKGNIKAAIFVIWIDTYNVKDTKAELIDAIIKISNEINMNREIIQIVKNANELEANSTKIKMIMGIEGLDCIADDLNILDMLYIYGVRHASLTWNETNALATGADGDQARGLTKLGIRAIKRLEALNMIIDVSHANEKTFWDIISHTKKPLIASHSNSRAICEHKRNLSDAQLKAIADRKGVVGVNIHRHFVSCNKDSQNVKRLVDHIDHMRQIIGIDHIGFGFDFCEYLDGSADSNIEGLDNVSDIGLIIHELKNRNYTDIDIAKISYQNFQRVIEEILK